MATYKIVRMYLHHATRTIERGLTLEEAQAHCQDPDSSSTSNSARAKAITRRANGAWFDGYKEE